MILIAYYVLRTPQYRQGISQQRYCSTLPPNVPHNGCFNFGPALSWTNWNTPPKAISEIDTGQPRASNGPD